MADLKKSASRPRVMMGQDGGKNLGTGMIIFHCTCVYMKLQKNKKYNETRRLSGISTNDYF